MSEYYDKQGKAIDFLEWGKLYGNKEYKIIKQEDVGKYWVSTVWLGIDHSFGEGKPLIFETMVFEKENGKTNYSDLDTERYTTLE